MAGFFVKYVHGRGRALKRDKGRLKRLHLVRNIGNYLGKHRCKVGGVGHHVRGNPIDPYVPLIKMVNAGRGSAQPFVRVHPFPTELFDEVGDRIREVGHEYGTITDRPLVVGLGVGIRVDEWVVVPLIAVVTVNWSRR